MDLVKGRERKESLGRQLKGERIVQLVLCFTVGWSRSWQQDKEKQSGIGERVSEREYQAAYRFIQSRKIPPNGSFGQIKTQFNQSISDALVKPVQQQQRKMRLKSEEENKMRVSEAKGKVVA